MSTEACVILGCFIALVLTVSLAFMNNPTSFEGTDGLEDEYGPIGQERRG